MARFASAVLLAASLAIAPAWADDEGNTYDAPGGDESADAPDPEPDYGRGVNAAPPIAERDSILASHGTWVHHRSWGRVWHPRVAVGWRPYTNGYWAWSPYGWTWVSSEPWGWAFHYGRWGWYDHYGWVWVPGTVWAPAWVDWWEGDGWIGWAPLGPAGWVGVRHHYVFVHDRDFCDRHLHHHIHDHRHVSSFGVHGWEGRRSGPPPLHRVERVSRHPVVRMRDPRRGDSFGTQRLPAPTRPGGVQARRDARAIRPTPVLPRGFQDGRGRMRVPRAPEQARPARPSEPFRPGPPAAGKEARRGGWQRPPGRVEFGGDRIIRGGGVTQSPIPRSHFRGETGARGRTAAPGGSPTFRAPGAPSGVRAPGGLISPGTGGVRGAGQGGGSGAGGGSRHGLRGGRGG
jgi:hypothetical protein